MFEEVLEEEACSESPILEVGSGVSPSNRPVLVVAAGFELNRPRSEDVGLWFPKSLLSIGCEDSLLGKWGNNDAAGLSVLADCSAGTLYVDVDDHESGGLLPKSPPPPSVLELMVDCVVAVESEASELTRPPGVGFMAPKPPVDASIGRGAPPNNPPEGAAVVLDFGPVLPAARSASRSSSKDWFLNGSFAVMAW
jgi:hypothetical protein